MEMQEEEEAVLVVVAEEVTTTAGESRFGGVCVCAGRSLESE
jgi:hypothetical protein